MALFGNDAEIAPLKMRIAALEQRVEQLAQLLDAPPAPRDAQMGEVIHLKQSGKQIQAIKLLREIQPGLGLAEAKALVDQM